MKKLFLLSLVILTLQSSCQLQKTVVNVYTPSHLVFPPEVRTVLVTSRFVPARGNYEDVQWGAYESVDSLKWSLSESIVDTLSKKLAEGNKYLVKIRHLPRMLRHNSPNLPDPLPWPGLSDLATKEYVQSVLVLEGFGITSTPVVYSEENGNVLAQFSTQVTLAIRVYEPAKMRIIDDSVYTFSSGFQGTGKTREEAAGKLPDDLAAMHSACSNAALEYSRLIIPGEIQVKRFFYPDGDTTLVKADKDAREGKWGRAESHWKWLAYNSPDSAIQARASYNMALACERDGRLNQAMGFAKRSQRIRPDKRTLDYISVLNKRTLEFEGLVKSKVIIKRW